MPTSIGDYYLENYLRLDGQNTVAAYAGSPLVTITPALDQVRGVSFQLITGNAAVRSIVHNAADAVVASTGTWHFVNGAFTAGDVGAAMVIANAANGGNNGSKTILTVVDSTHVTTATTSLVNETFGVTVTATITDLTATGVWTVEASNDYVQTTLPGLNQTQANGVAHWSAIANSQFLPAIADVSAPSSQYVQLDPFDGRRLRFTLTVSAGSALVTITYSAKGPK